jgi:hypothetical protein
MIRWGFVGFTVLAMAVLMHFTPAAYADGCEGGDSTAGHNAIAFCCGGGNGGTNEGHGGTGTDKGTGVNKAARFISR